MMPIETAGKEDLVRRMQCEFLEMPGLQLSLGQACRLWGLDATTCGDLLERLVHAKFLCRTRTGGFARVEGH